MVSKNEIIALEARLYNAIKSSNVEELDALLHEDLLFNSPGGQVITKAMDLDNYRSGNMSIQSFIPSDQQINVIGDTAIVSVKIALEGKYLDQPIAGNFHYIRVWKSFNNSWKVIAGAASVL